MGVSDILTPDRVSVAGAAEGPVRTKPEAIRRLAALLSRKQTVVTPEEIEAVLDDREQLQSTGIGGGVAFPHGAIEKLSRTVCAVLICPEAIPFDAIDGAPVTILFALVGPRREHLKALARVSRLLRDDGFRKRLVAARAGSDAYALIAAEEGRGTLS
jgi:PTS system nitrogen regulatory IIA component